MWSPLPKDIIGYFHYILFGQNS